jgi:hypothetical protein
MTAINGLILPTVDKRPEADSWHRKIGPLLAVIGMVIATATAVANWSTIGDIGVDDASVAETDMWAGGLGVAGLGVIKVGIAVVLVGIIHRLWGRADSVMTTVPHLHARPDAVPLSRTPRKTKVSEDIPAPLPIHKLATRLWKPMLAMGAMGVIGGTIVRVAAASETAGTEAFRQATAWGVGLEFFGETLLLGGISFLLGTILASLRQAGGEVQRAAGEPVTVLAMSGSANAFIILMMVGTMVGIAQFVASIVLAGRADSPTSYAELATFVNPIREVALGLLLGGIVLALATIGTVLSFQFDRVRELVRRNA